MDLLGILARRIRLMSARAVVYRVDDSLNVQGVQIGVLADEVAQAQRFQQYGFSSVPLSGAEAIMVSISGVRSHAVVIATDDGRHRKKNMQPGEVALYTDEGDYILFGRGHKIKIVSTGEVDVTAPTVTITASTKITLDTPELHCTGKITATGDVVAGTVSLDQHVHTGVTSGTELTGPPAP